MNVLKDALLRPFCKGLSEPHEASLWVLTDHWDALLNAKFDDLHGKLVQLVRSDNFELRHTSQVR